MNGLCRAYLILQIVLKTGYKTLHRFLQSRKGVDIHMAIKKSSIHQHDRIVCLLSHAKDGITYARYLSEALHSWGIQVEYARTTKADNLWLESIRNFITHVDVVILIGSPQAMRSNYLRNEVEFFQRQKRGLLLPILFVDNALPAAIPFEMQEYRWLREHKQALLRGPTMEVMQNIRRFFKDYHLSSRPAQSKPPLRKKRVLKRPLNEGKLILVGRGEVGKTSIVRSLMNLDFRGDESKTQGINITTWSIECGEAPVRLNVWDFGGQEIMHATHQFFLTERSLYLLVLNGREGAEDLDADYWMRHIESFGNESPVIVVQNKIGQQPFDLNYRGLQARYPQIRGYVKTDCRDGIGIDALRDLIRSVTSQMPEVRMKFPVDWFAVKESIETQGDDFIGYEAFRQLCARHGVSDQADQDGLCWVLHCLGIALNYRDDPRLRETSVLKPEWVTQGIYRILNATELAQRHGELRLQDLEQLLPSKQYPLEKHVFLMELMRKFSLCFAFPDEPDRYLIPELLGKEEPRSVQKLQPANCLNFEYHYGLLPEGLIPRLIARSHTLSHNCPRWRTGVVMAHEDCKALVKAEAADRRVIVRIGGDDRGARRRLLAIIRYDLDRIHHEFKDRLDAEPKVPLPKHPQHSVGYQKLVVFERQGVTNFPECIGGKVVSVDVSELLNGVDLEKQREESDQMICKAKSVFFSYSHKDEALRDKLETHLKLLQRQGIISSWHDRKILPGSEWDQEIDQHLHKANIILLLVSAEFIASNYCWDIEVAEAIKRHESKKAIVVPIIIRTCDWHSSPFGKLQALPKDGKAITAWSNRDAAWTNVAEGLRKIAES